MKKTYECCLSTEQTGAQRKETKFVMLHTENQRTIRGKRSGGASGAQGAQDSVLCLALELSTSQSAIPSSE